MAEKAGVKESLPDLDDLLQCPVCYEIPSGHIYQCDQGHHVCGRCKVRLNECPVCRALFFGTRNYAMEELIANVKKLQAFKLGGKVTVGTNSSENTAQVTEETTTGSENNRPEDDEHLEVSSQSTARAPQACKGLFRCLCCKNGNGERLPSARLLNHLRYFHSPELIEGKSENGEYLQAWQFSTVPGRLVTAVRVSDMGIFFLVIEISNDLLYAWLSMAAAPWIAHDFCYTVTISGRDREAIFSDCVWSVRSCEGSLKKRGHCLMVNGVDARALTAPATVNGKLCIRRAPGDPLTSQTQPRAVLRVASRGNPPRALEPPDLEPFFLDLQNDVARLARAFDSIGREASARALNATDVRRAPAEVVDPEPVAPVQLEPPPPQPMSRNARRRMRQRLRAAMNANPPAAEAPATNSINAVEFQNGQVVPHANPSPNAVQFRNGQVVPHGNSPSAVQFRNAPVASNANSYAAEFRNNQVVPHADSSYAAVEFRNGQEVPHASSPYVIPAQFRNGHVASPSPQVHRVGFIVAQPYSAPPVPPAAGGPSQGHPQNGQRNKKKRRQRR